MIYSHEKIHSGSIGTINIRTRRWIPQQCNERRISAVFYDLICFIQGVPKLVI